MDNLRVILLVLGLLLIGGLVLHYRSKRWIPMLLSRLKQWLVRSQAADVIDSDVPADLDQTDLPALQASAGAADPDVDALGPITAIPEEEAPDGEPLIIALNIMARPPARFHGLDILAALKDNGFVFGEMNIFHYYPEGAGGGRPLCSIANTVEPGRFDIEHLAELETPGLSLFMQLPGPLEGRAAFDKVLQLGRTLADRLGGDLCDETRSVLTLQTIGHLKETIENFRFRQKMAGLRRHRSPAS